MMMFKNVLLAAALGMSLTACATQPPATLDGLKQVFHDPGFAVQGKARKDQVWISSTQETGIRVLGWARPKGVAGHKVVLAKTPRAAQPITKSSSKTIKSTKPSSSGHILLPKPRSEIPTNEDGAGVASPAPAIPAPRTVVAQPRPKTMTERLKDEVRVLNERVRKLEGK